MSVICVVATPTPLAPPANFVHEQIVGDSTHTFLSWDAVSGAAKYNVRLESSGTLLATGLAGSAGTGSYTGKLVYTLGTGTGGESALTPSTLYRVYMTATLSDGSRESAPSIVDGALTANPPVSGSSFNTNSPTFTPALPWIAGPGTSSYGGSGRDAPSGGSVASQTIYLCGTVAQLRTACNATGRRWAILYKSGVYDIGPDGETEIRNDGLLTIIDLSPAPGSIIQGGAFPVWNNTGTGLATRGQDIHWCNLRIYDKARTVGNGFAIGTQENAATYQRILLTYCTVMYSYDQIITLVGKIRDSGLFGCNIAKAVRNSVHPEGAHSTGVITTWTGASDDMGVTRTIMSDNAWRNPLMPATNGLISDCLIHNFNLGVQIQQQNSTFTTGYPTNTTVEGCLFVRGVDGAGAQVISISPTFDARLHTGSHVCVRGCAGIGYTDTTQSALCYNPQGYTIESVPQAATPFKGYNYNPITATTPAKAAQAALMIAHCGAWPSSRDTASLSVLNGIAASVVSPGSGGDIIDEFEEIYPTLAVNTADYVSGPYTLRGISAMTTGGFALGAAGRVILTTGPYVNYSAFEADVFEYLKNVCGVHA